MNIELVIGIGSAILTSIVGPISVNVYERWQAEKKKNSDDPVKNAIDLNTLITSKLEEIKEMVNADRIFLCQFHNGGHFYPTGQSIQKFSMIYEILEPEVVSQQQQFQNIPIGIFSKPINKLADGDPIKIIDYKKDENFGLASLAENGNTKSTYLFPIFTIDNKFAGIVGVDFVDDNVFLDDAEVSEIATQVSSIGGSLLNDLKKKIK